MPVLRRPHPHKRQFRGTAILHDCTGDAECFCMYEDTCTGKFSQRMIRVPIWLDVILRPVHAFRVLRARRRIARHNA